MISFTQTQLWAEINGHCNRLEPRRIESHGISCLFGYDKKKASLTSFGGPVLSAEISYQELHSFLVSLFAKAKKENIHKLNFRSLFPLRKWNGHLEEEFLKLGFQRQEWKTLIIDLSLSEETLFKNFEHSARKGIKKSNSLGVKVERCDSFENYFSEFLVPYSKVTNRSLRDKDFYKNVWDLDNQNVYGYWVAKDNEGELLAFLGSYRYDKVATEIMSAITPLGYEKKIPAQDKLHWEIMKHHRNMGDMFFDLAGFNPAPISEKEKNIRRYKEKWGGKIYDVSSYTLDNRSLLQKLISKITRRIHG